MAGGFRTRRFSSKFEGSASGSSSAGGHGNSPSLRQLIGSPQVQSSLDCVARKYRCSRQELCKRGKRGNEARAVAMVLVWDCCGMGLREVGELFGGAQYTAVAQMIARTRAKDTAGQLQFSLSQLLGKCQK